MAVLILLIKRLRGTYDVSIISSCKVEKRFVIEMVRPATANWYNERYIIYLLYF